MAASAARERRERLREPGKSPGFVRAAARSPRGRRPAPLPRARNGRPSPAFALEPRSRRGPHWAGLLPMAPEVSTLRAGARSLPQRALKQYLLLLRLYPVLTKAATSGILSAFGNFLSQIIERVRKKGRWFQNLDLRGPLRYAIFGFFFSGPLSHFFYLYLDHWIPAAVSFSGVKRLLVDRLVFGPAFLFFFFFCMNLLEGKDMAAFFAKVKTGYWPALQMNWKVWTPIQFININYIPLQFRVLFANIVALFWYTYLASLGK